MIELRLVACRLGVRERTTQFEHNESAYPLIADMGANIADGSELPRTGLMHRSKMGTSFDHLVGALLERQRHVEAERLGGLEVDH